MGGGGVCFMPGGGGYLVRIHKGTQLLFGLGNEKNSLLRKKNHSPPPLRVSNGPPLTKLYDCMFSP